MKNNSRKMPYHMISTIQFLIRLHIDNKKKLKDARSMENDFSYGFYMGKSNAYLFSAKVIAGRFQPNH